MGEKSTAPSGSDNKLENDVFRYTLVRYLAYAEEIGTAVSTYAPCGFSKYLNYFPAITHTYIIMDTLSKGKAAYNAKNAPPKEDKKENKDDDKDDKNKKDKKKGKAGKDENKGDDDKDKDKSTEKPPSPALAALDRYGWHMLASVVIPKYTLRQVHCGLDVFADFLRLCRPVRTYFTTALALATIPLIIRPIDAISDHIMDMSYRSVFGSGKKEDDKKEEEDK